MTTTAPALTVLPGDYLAADPIIDHTHPAIRAAAASLLRAQDEVATADAVFTFVRDEIPHSHDIDVWSAAYVASDVLAQGNAICHGKSHLLAALLRASGIPAGLCYQRAGLVHGLNAVYLQGRWVRLDARGNRPGVDARFSADPADERLAFALDPARGEIDYLTVHPAVPPRLLAGLRRAVPGEAGFDYLPGEL
ncbi:transglutaminase-like domain-containing protein [Streptacidiphilus sp. PAMC 29251]